LARFIEENSIDKKALGLLFPTITGRSVWRVRRWRVFEFKVRSLSSKSSMWWGRWRLRLFNRSLFSL